MASYHAPSNSPSKRKKQSDVHFLSSDDKVFGELLQGGIEVWTVERGFCDDGFTFDFAVSLEDSTEFQRQHGILCWTKRRTSKIDNRAARNASNGYGRMVLVRLVAESTMDSRRSFADSFVQVSTIPMAYPAS